MKIESQSKIEISDEIKPRAFRKLGLPLEWDRFVDELAMPSSWSINSLMILGLRIYRTLRPDFIGNRCGFEPSCSRYSEICFRAYGSWRGLMMTIDRLSRCDGKTGGLDLPSNGKCTQLELKEKIHALQN